jgi:hypothetical protein
MPFANKNIDAQWIFSEHIIDQHSGIKGIGGI